MANKEWNSLLDLDCTKLHRFQNPFQNCCATAKSVNNFKMRRMNFIAFYTDPIQIGFLWLLFCFCTKLQHVACVKGINLMCFLSATAQFFSVSYGLLFRKSFHSEKKILHSQMVLMWMDIEQYGGFVLFVSHFSHFPIHMHISNQRNFSFSLFFFVAVFSFALFLF